MATVVTLAKAFNTAAEIASYGGPDFTSLGFITAGTATAIVTGTANTQLFADYVTVSYSLAISAATTVTIKDGSTVIWTLQLGITTGPTQYHFDFSHRPLRASSGANLSVDAGSGGTSNICAVMLVGHSDKSQTTY